MKSGPTMVHHYFYLLIIGNETTPLANKQRKHQKSQTQMYAQCLYGKRTDSVLGRQKNVATIGPQYQSYKCPVLFF